jgi:hypothetical protein
MNYFKNTRALKDVHGDVENFVVQSVVELAYSDVESALPELIMDKYGLEPVFRKFRCLPENREIR